jgi:hypothetical protein
MNGKTTPLLLFVLLYVTPVLAQPVVQPIGATANALGGASLMSTNAFSTFNNPATMANAATNQFAIYNSIPFTIKNLATVGVGSTLNSKFATFGIGVLQYGYHAFNHQRFTFSAAKKLSNTLNIGIGLTALITNVLEQDATFVILGELGVNYKLNEQINLAAYIFNPTRQNDFTYNQQGPSLVRSGLNYSINKQLTTFFELEKQNQFETIYRVGIMYELRDNVFLKGGYQSWPASFTGGLTLPYKNFMFGFATQTHQVLGITPSITMQYNR